MKLSDLIPLFESAETKKLGQLINMSNKAYKSLPKEAQMAILNWESANWDEGELSQSFRDKGELLNTINNAFAPVKKEMHRLFGDTILLHRGQRTLTKDGSVKDGTGGFNDQKVLFSFSFDENVAKEFAYDTRRQKPPSEQEVQKVIDQYNRTGYVQFQGKHYKRSKEYPDYLTVYDRYRNRISDMPEDELEWTLQNNRHMAQEYWEEEQAKGEVRSIEVPIDKIVWLTNNRNSKEFIVALNPLEV